MSDDLAMGSAGNFAGRWSGPNYVSVTWMGGRQEVEVSLDLTDNGAVSGQFTVVPVNASTAVASGSFASSVANPNFFTGKGSGQFSGAQSSFYITVETINSEMYGNISVLGPEPILISFNAAKVG